MNIYEETKFLMKKYNINANKNLGQNFLIDDNVIENIIKTAEIETKVETATPIVAITSPSGVAVS